MPKRLNFRLQDTELAEVDATFADLLAAVELQLRHQNDLSASSRFRFSSDGL